MDAGYIAALAGLVGAAIGSASTITTMLVQARFKDRRDRSKQVTEMALAEFKSALELATSGKGPPNVFPLSLWLYHNDLLLTAIENRDLTPEKLREISASAEKMVDAIKDIDADRRARTTPASS